MDFDLNDEQKEIKRVAHELLAVRSPFPKVREAPRPAAYDPALWNELVELGWPGIAVSAEHGGPGPRGRRARRAAGGARVRVRGDARTCRPRPRRR